MKFCPADSALRGRFALSAPSKVALLSLAAVLLISTDPTSAQGTHDPQFKNAVPCASLADGNYVWGCSRIYSMCANGREHVTHCFQNLVLDPDTNQCESPKKVWICQNPQPGSLYRSRDPFTCNGKQSGNYESTPCGGQYYECHNGRKFDRTCQAGLLYNPRASVCDFPANCDSKAQTQHAQPVQLGGPNGGGNSQPNNGGGNSQPNNGGGNSQPNNGGGNSQPINGGGNPQSNNSQSQPQRIPSSKSPILRRQFQAKQEGRYFYLRRSANNAGAPYKLISDETVPSSKVADTFIVQGGQSVVPNAPSPSAYGAPVLYGNAPAAPPPQTQEAAEPSAEAGFDCTGQADGIYLTSANACATSFWKCANGNAFDYVCPAGLVYDATAGQCEHAQFVAACGGTPPTTTEAAPPAAPVAPTSAFDCSGKKDGFYENQPCSPTYFSCNGGSSWTFACPSGLVFDKNSSVCEYPSLCGQPKPTSPPQDPHGAANFYFNQESTTPPPTTPKPPFDCTGKADGYYYKKKCTPKFIICSKGHLSQQACPEGLLFDPTLAACQHAHECGRSTTTPAPRTTTAAPQFIVSTTPVPEFNCTGVEDGYYVKQPCTSTFFTCASGYTIPMACPPTLVFDPSVNICEYPNICGATLTTEAPPAPPPAADTSAPANFATVGNSPYAANQGAPNSAATAAAAVAQAGARKSAQSAYQKPSQSAAAQPSAAVVPTAPSVPTTTTPPDFECGGKVDGFYAKAPCTPTYFSCAAGAATQNECQGGLVFDAQLVLCDYPSVCGQPRTTTTTTTAAPIIAAAAATAPSAAAGSAPIPGGAIDQSGGPKPFSCVGRENGYFINRNCQPSFYACHNGVGTKMTCPEGLLLDTITAVCEYPEACGRPKTQPQYVKTTGQQQQSTQPQQQQQQQQPIQKPDFDCSGKDNGNFPQGHCQNAYIVCVHSAPFQSNCPTGLVYDEETGKCEFPDQCGQSPDSGEEPEEGEQPQQTAPIQADVKSPPSSPYSAPSTNAANASPASAASSGGGNSAKSLRRSH